MSYTLFVKNPIKIAMNLESNKLEEYLRKVSVLYYNTGKSPINDEIFDKLKEILEDKDSNNSFLNEIGAPVSRDKVELPYPMASLNKVKPETNDFNKWIKMYHGPYELSDKMDGISAMLYKKDNETKLYTRGDGKYGQDITHLLKYMNISTDVIPNNTAVRGELIMTKKNFTKISDKMSNARNAVAGIVNSKIIDSKMIQMLDFITYNVIYPELLQTDQYDKLTEWGFDVVIHKEVTELSIDNLVKYFKERREESPYEIDGIVVMDNNMAYSVSDKNPKYGFAFKSIMHDQHTNATVTEVDWRISRHGYIKPRIRIEPVKLDGVIIEYATAHNAKYVYDNKIGEGTRIKIIRSGDVIPKIMEVLTPSNSGEPDMPDIPYEWNDTEVDIIVKEETDESKNITTIKQLVNTMKTLGIKYIDEKTTEKLVVNGYNTFIKILKADRDKITKIIGDKLTNKIYTEIIETLKKTQLHILMAASNYFGRGMGTRKIQIITKAYPDIMTRDWNTKELYSKVIALNGFQDKTTEKFVEGFEKFKKFFEKLQKYTDLDYLVMRDSERGESNNTLNLFINKKVVLTGFRSSEIVNFIEKNGGSVTGSVSKNTSLVVCNDVSEESTKLSKAKELGIRIITKNDFIAEFMK